jgi:hypothetical protein
VLCIGAFKSNEGKQWKFSGYEVHNVPYDGQCGFTAVGHQLAYHKYRCEREVTGDRVRRDIVEAIRLHRQLQPRISERLAAEGRSLDQYLTEMAKSSTWADDLAMYAASVVYDVSIRILRENSSSVNIGLSTCNQSITLGYVSCQPGEQPNHYVSLLPVAGMFTLCMQSC